MTARRSAPSPSATRSRQMIGNARTVGGSTCRRWRRWRRGASARLRTAADGGGRVCSSAMRWRAAPASGAGARASRPRRRSRDAEDNATIANAFRDFGWRDRTPTHRARPTRASRTTARPATPPAAPLGDGAPCAPGPRSRVASCADKSAWLDGAGRIPPWSALGVTPDAVSFAGLSRSAMRTRSAAAASARSIAWRLFSARSPRCFSEKAATSACVVGTFASTIACSSASRTSAAGLIALLLRRVKERLVNDRRDGRMYRPTAERLGAAPTREDAASRAGSSALYGGLPVSEIVGDDADRPDVRATIRRTTRAPAPAPCTGSYPSEHPSSSRSPRAIAPSRCRSR